ncbi:unnamed protein product [Cyclocybe aegerita]|uniref:Pentatricopeptide repeat-containing protein n=1 Tax=Cyclocybe aegerita TaxID=1973307 RepID=A0A8S0WVR2_CYCAE|nr:unnamed protein product [Cyclocybe aegerita]
MLRRASRHNTYSLLEFLLPNPLCRIRHLSETANAVAPTRKVPDLQIHTKLRDQIMGQPHSRRMLPEATKNMFNTHLGQVDKALKTWDLPAVLQHWETFEVYRNSLPDGEACRLPVQTLKELQKVFIRRFPLTCNSEQWSDALMAKAEDFVVHAAKHDSAESLYMLLLHYIGRGDTDAILKLYDRYLQAIGTDATEPQEDIGTNETLALPDDEDPYLDGFRMPVVLCAMTAHIMNDSFQIAMETLMSSGVKIQKFRKQEFLKRLRDPALSRKVEKYINQATIARLVQRPSSLSKHILNIAHPTTVRSLERLYNDVVEGISGSDPYLAASASASSGGLVPMSEVGWTSFQTGFIKSERIDLAARMWDDLARLGVTPGVTMWTGLLDTYADLRDSTQARETWNMMLRQGIKPDVLSYRAIIAVHFDDNKTEDALAKFEEYRATVEGDDERRSSVYNTVLRGLLRINRIADAEALLVDMEKNEPAPDIVSYNTLLGYHSRQMDFKQLSQVVATMSSKKIMGDVVTFSTILSALLLAGRKDATATIFNLMQKQGIKPSVATYTSIINDQMKQQTEGSLNAALSILDKMEQDSGVKPNEVTYTTILSGLSRGRWLSRERADQVRDELVARMRKQRLAFKLPTYHTLIRSALDSPDPKGHLDALGLIQEMEEQGIPRVNATWYLLFAGLMRREEWSVARMMVRKMSLINRQPNPAVLKLVRDIRLQKNA